MAVVDQTRSLQQYLFLQTHMSDAVCTITCKSASDIFKTDELLAESNMAHHIKSSQEVGWVTL
jgi:hypothetical protein